MFGKVTRRNLLGGLLASLLGPWLRRLFATKQQTAEPPASRVPSDYYSCSYPSDPAGRVTTYTYNCDHKLTSITESVGRITTMVYNTHGRPLNF
jgi:uncharacterized protein RhaS with RHS repeats